MAATAAASPTVLEHQYEPAEPGPESHPIKRPVILGVEIRSARGELLGTTRGLVDSGADFTTLHSEWAEELGINIKDDCTPVSVRVVGPDPVVHYVYTGGLTIRVLGEDLFLPVVKFVSGLGFVCLGRKDFFERYVVTFDQRNLRSFTERLPEPVEEADDGDDDPELSAAVLV